MMKRDIPIDEGGHPVDTDARDGAADVAAGEAAADPVGGAAEAALSGSDAGAGSGGDDPTGDLPPRGDVETSVEASDSRATEGRIAELQEEVATLNDQHLRLAAEFQNYRKRVNRERDQMRARSQAELVGVLLDALDDLERVTNVDAESASTASLIEGVDLVERKLQRALEAAGAETIDAVGKRFDPETMEALGALPTDDPDQDETVAMTFQRGYRMHGILVRPARVQVLKHGD